MWSVDKHKPNKETDKLMLGCKIPVYVYVCTHVDSVCLYTTKKDHYIVKRLPVYSSNCGATLMMCNTSSVPAICPQDVSIKKHSFNQHR